MRDKIIELIVQANELCAKRFREETKAVLKQKGCFSSKADRKENMYEIEADYLIENGVILPPCKVGDTVYEIQPIRRRIQPYIVTKLIYNGTHWHFEWELKKLSGIYGNVNGFCDYEIGKTVFLSEEVAENKLKEIYK